MNSPRKQYITLLKSRKNQSIEVTRQAYLSQKNSINIRANRKRDRSYDNNKNNTQRNKLEKSSTAINRRSMNRIDKLLNMKTFRYKSKKESTNKWSRKSLPFNKKQYEEEQKRNQEGFNCRIVIICEGKTKSQHFLDVKQIQQIRAFLHRQYKKVKYFRTVPRQLSLEYLLTQKQISGQFLNGQSIYFKPQFQDVFEKVQVNSQLTLQHFEIIKPIGSGGFSKVFFCRCKFDSNFYAMKLIDKEMIVKHKKKRIIINERNIMKDSSHPFLIQLKYAFETEKYLVFIVEYCAGGQLFGLIRRFRRLSQQMAKFYIIQIFLGLKYLHDNKVIYRDIKPENILLGIDGHVKIADLGLAKPNMHEGQLAYSFCGSPEYMSPQMIMQVGHTYPVDYYCMGALLYELLTGLPPFYSQDPEQIYEAVLVQELTFPDDVALTPECKSLLQSLLCKDAKQRLGSLHGIKQILAHPWFGKHVYKNFIDKKVDPPIDFKGLEKISLDQQNEEKKQVYKQLMDKVLKDQKNEKEDFKKVMKNFSYDFRDDQRFRECSNLIKKKLTTSGSRREYSGEKMKENMNQTTRKMKRKSGIQLCHNNLKQFLQR